MGRTADAWGPKSLSPREAGHWAPQVGIFAPTTGLDHRLFDEHGRLRSAVREALMGRLDRCIRVDVQLAGSDWQEWLRVYLAGGSASEWAGPRPNEAAQDLDVLAGLDLAAAQGHSAFEGMDGEQAATALNAAFRSAFNEGDAVLDGVEGRWSLTAYCNPAVGGAPGGIEAIRPYAAYDITDGCWAVRPPHLPGHSLADFDPALIQEARAVASEARAILRLPEPMRTREARALWERIHADRSRAFSPGGEGWQDAPNVIEKWLSYAPRHLLDKVRELALARTAAFEDEPTTKRFFPGDDLSAMPSGGRQIEWVKVKSLKDYREYDHDPETGRSTSLLTWKSSPDHYTPERWERLRDSVRRGFTEPLKLEYNPETRRAYIGEGNHRLRAAEDVGHEAVPVWGLSSGNADRFRRARRVPGEPSLVPERGYGYFPSSFRPSQVVPSSWLHAGDQVRRCPLCQGSYQPGQAAAHLAGQHPEQWREAWRRKPELGEMYPELAPRHASHVPEDELRHASWRDLHLTTEEWAAARREPWHASAKLAQAEVRRDHPALTRPFPAGEEGDEMAGHMFRHVGLPEDLAATAYVARHPDPGRMTSNPSWTNGRPGVALHPDRWDYGTCIHEAAHHKVMHDHAIGPSEDQPDEQTHGPEWAQAYARGLNHLARHAGDDFLYHHQRFRDMIGEGLQYQRPRDLDQADEHHRLRLAEGALPPVAASWDPDTSGSDKTGIYLRFGRWPENERSFSPAGGYHEEGVSAYDLDKDGNPDIDLGLNRDHVHDEYCDEDCTIPTDEYGNDPREEMQGRVERAERNRRSGTDNPGETGHLVRGEMTGVGYDGEPLLKNVRRVGDWIDHRHLLIPGATRHRLARDPYDEDYEPPEEEPPMHREAASGYTGLTKRSGMIYLDLPSDAVRHVPGGVDDHHVTICYLGKNVDDSVLTEACRRAEQAASSVPPLRCLLRGIDTFPASDSSDGKIPAFVPAYIPGIGELRRKLEDLSASEHRHFRPHVTLGYFSDEEELPPPHPPVNLIIRNISVKRGDDVFSFPFGGREG